jgi:hypothetical protein
MNARNAFVSIYIYESDIERDTRVRVITYAYPGCFRDESTMPFEQYHEPAEELPDGTRTFARLIMSMIEEADAINWYEQRIAVEDDEEAKQVMSHAQKEEFIHFGMDLEFLLRRNPTWRKILKNILFKKGDLVELAEHSEEAVSDE